MSLLHTFNVQILITADFMPQWTIQMNDSDISDNSAVFAFINRGNSEVIKALMMKLILLNVWAWQIIGSLSTSQKKQSNTSNRWKLWLSL